MRLSTVGLAAHSKPLPTFPLRRFLLYLLCSARCPRRTTKRTRLGVEMTEHSMPEEKVLENLNSVSTAKRIANLVSFKMHHFFGGEGEVGGRPKGTVDLPLAGTQAWTLRRSLHVLMLGMYGSSRTSPRKRYISHPMRVYARPITLQRPALRVPVCVPIRVLSAHILFASPTPFALSPLPPRVPQELHDTKFGARQEHNKKKAAQAQERVRRREGEARSAHRRKPKQAKSQIQK